LYNTRYDTPPPAPRYGSQATWLLIVACIVVYPFGFSYHNMLAFRYSAFSDAGHWWTLATALFVHGSLGHLLGNLLFLFLFGRSLENIIGPARLLLVFFTGGALSLLASHLFYPAGMPIVGASGSICTILGLLMIYSPWKISFLLNFFPMPLGVAALTYMIMNYVMAQSNHRGNTAYELHIMGFLVGLIFGVLWVADWKKNLLISILSFIAFYIILFIIISYFRLRIIY